MKFEILDPNVDLGMNIMLIIANVLNLVYNIPQMIKTYRSKSTRDFSGWFLSLRIVGNAIWLIYAIDVENLLMIINNLVTVLASVFVAYYKVKEMAEDRRAQGRPSRFKDLKCPAWLRRRKVAAEDGFELVDKQADIEMGIGEPVDESVIIQHIDKSL